MPNLIELVNAFWGTHTYFNTAAQNYIKSMNLTINLSPVIVKTSHFISPQQILNFSLSVTQIAVGVTIGCVAGGHFNLYLIRERLREYIAQNNPATLLLEQGNVLEQTWTGMAVNFFRFLQGLLN